MAMVVGSVAARSAARSTWASASVAVAAEAAAEVEAAAEQSGTRRAERGTTATAAVETTAASNLFKDAPDGAPPSGNAKTHSIPSRDDGVEEQVAQVL